jgi:5-methylcytosine-specific restriction endonuclease McrA
MRAAQKILAIAQTDSTFKQVELRGSTGWVGKCLHCRKKLLLENDGTPINSVTIEHIVPKNHGGTDDLENLGLACGPCNNGKGVRIDVLRATDAKYLKVVEQLKAERMKRWREPQV